MFLPEVVELQVRHEMANFLLCAILAITMATPEVGRDVEFSARVEQWLKNRRTWFQGCNYFRLCGIIKRRFG